MYPSLQRRLMVAVLSVSALIYLVSASSFYGVLHHSSYRAIQDALNVQLELVKGLLEKEENGTVELELSEIRSGNYVEKFSGRYFLVMVPGQPPILSGSLGGKFPDFGGQLPLHNPMASFLNAKGPMEEPLMLLTQTVRFANRDVLLAVAEPLSQTQKWLTRVLVLLLLGLPFALLLLLVLVGWVIKLGLGPLNRLVKEIESFDFQNQADLQLEKTDRVWELQELARAFNSLLERIYHVRRAEEQLLQDVSHQLKTPVTVILTTCDVMLQRQRQADMYQEALEQIRLTGWNMRQLLGRLLSTAHLSSESRRMLTLEVISLEQVVEQALAMIQPLALKKHIILNYRSEQPALVNGDLTRLIEVLVILLENALLYSPEGSEVSLFTRVKETFACLSVQDQGPGIPAEDLPHLFERFYRGNNAKDTEGSGLGLAIAQQIAQLHHGRISVDTIPGQGTEFILNLPVQRI